jgi:aspartyl-tRNA(Asn)/glutamyl-tRNA(Gln) amidotransferase subunit A
MTCLDSVQVFLDRIQRYERGLNTFITVTAKEARQMATRVDETRESGADPGPLAGVPLAVKDTLCTRGVRTTCGSAILADWQPPYDATVVARALSAGAVLMGKTNLDEFAMGSSTEHSAFGPTHNPHDETRVPGGSSGGSAAAVAAGFAVVALGSDTGGSVRQPAALCGVVGLKPTYGLVSRYGLIAYASSLDQVGCIARNVSDAALLLAVIAGHDPADSTSIPGLPTVDPRLDEGVDGLRVGIIEELMGEEIAPAVRSAVSAAGRSLDAAGAVVEPVSIPALTYGLSAYYLIATAEASSNLARFDGVRYGLRVDGIDTTEMMTKTRTAGFGSEVKRRILLGTYALSAGYYDQYYGKAQRVRTLIIRELNEVYDRYDVLLGPTSPTTAFPLGAKLADPLTMYLGDVCTVPSNLAGHPAISIPFGCDDDGLPIGVQVLAPGLGEHVMLRVAQALEEAAPPMPQLWTTRFA